MTHLDYGTDRRAAVRQAIALGRSSAFTRSAAPPLPRCDSPRWSRGVTQGPGRHAPCPCASRTDIDRSCPYVTLAAVAVEVTRQGTYLVGVSPHLEAARGEVVDVDGVDITIGGSGAVAEREMMAAERDDERDDETAPERTAREARRALARTLLDDVAGGVVRAVGAVGLGLRRDDERKP